MTNAEMIDAIIQSAKDTAIIEDTPFEYGEVWLNLAFRTEAELTSLYNIICR